MSDLIERQAAIDAISCDITVTGRQNAELVAATIGTFADRIKALPSVQPERKMGHWEDVPHKSVEHGEVVVDGETVRCSVCRHAEKGWNKGMNYCPNCGAKMEVEHEA